MDLCLVRPSHTDIRTALQKHRDNASISLEEYVRRHRIDLGRSLEGKVRIYLDKRYWIIARDADTGRRSDSASRLLLEELRRLTGSGKAFCPISDVVTIELLKQSNVDTRHHTARLIDELSLGVSLAPEEERVGTELAHLFQSLRDPDSVYNRDWLVWLRLGYSTFMAHPVNTGLQASDELALQKVIFDDMWTTSLQDIVKALGAATPPSLENFGLLAEKLNQGNQAHAADIRSFEQAYAAEVFGAVGVFAARGIEILSRMYLRDTGTAKALSKPDREKNEHVLRNVLANALRFGKLYEQLPSLHVLATCHAIYRWDKKRRFEANDLWDFHHAVAALGYCDAFFTEKDLRAVLTAGHVRLDEQLGCVVYSDIEKAVNWLRAL